MRFAPVLAVLALAAAGCSGSSPATATPAPATSETTAAAPVVPPSSAAPDGLTGFGATIDVWDATRDPDSDFQAGSVYDADPTLPPINGHTGARYVTVSGTETRVTHYQVNFHPQTSIADALADILQNEFPPDAKFLWKKDRTADGCYDAEVISPTFAKAATAAGIGDGSGMVYVYAQSNGANVPYFNASDVAFITLDFGSYKTPADTPTSC
jgi:hypothetical protein